jgi:hypothetical protein
MLRRTLTLLAAAPLALALVGGGDLRMPDMLKRQPPPFLASCGGDQGGLAPVSVRYTYADGTKSVWQPLHEARSRRQVVEQTVRDGLGRMRTIAC